MFHGRVTVLIIPQEGSKTFELKVPKVLVALGCCGAVVTVALLLIGGASYVQLRQLERSFAGLERDKELLVTQVGVVRELGRELSRLQKTNRQLHTILGQSVGLDPVEEVARDSHSEGLYIPYIDRLRWGRLRSAPTMWPVSGTVEGGFGQSAGSVIETPRGSLVRASGAGWVSRAAFDAHLGRLIRIDHGNGVVTEYGYNATLLVAEGDHVAKGQAIALSGYSGEAPGPALYFAVRENGEFRDPATYRLWM